MTTLAIVNARLLDPASDYDGPGAVLVEDGRIARVIHGAAPDLAAIAQPLIRRLGPRAGLIVDADQPAGAVRFEEL